MSKKYCPANGTDGMYFLEKWCMRCSRFRNHRCKILNATLVHSVDDKDYPSEWVENKDGLGDCTAFKKKLTFNQKKEH